MQFVNESEHVFEDISSEEWREYVFIIEGKPIRMKVEKPTHLAVSASGGHRLFTEEGVSVYVRSGWISLRWKAKEGRPHFEF